jgi:hypothetical protein
VVQRLQPNAFNKDVPNPWSGVTMKRRAKLVKAAVDREMVYGFAWKAIEAGYPEPAAAAVVCFEWLQRPENVLAGYITWLDYRGHDMPTAIKIVHLATHGVKHLIRLTFRTGRGLWVTGRVTNCLTMMSGCIVQDPCRANLRADQVVHLCFYLI